MSSSIIQLLVLAGIAVFLILRLRSVLGTRDGFEKPPIPRADPNAPRRKGRREFDVIEGGPDHDIVDNVPEGSPSAEALTAMKLVEPDLNVTEFIQGARGAYEMILMAFENGDLSEVRGFLGNDVAETFDEVLEARKAQGLRIEANFVGVREVSLVSAEFDRSTDVGEITVKFVGELTSVVKNSEGEVVEGNPNQVKRQKDVWTFSRKMGSDDPNWLLVATGE